MAVCLAMALADGCGAGVSHGDTVLRMANKGDRWCTAEEEAQLKSYLHEDAAASL